MIVCAVPNTEMEVFQQLFFEQPAGLGELIPRHFKANIYRRVFTGFEHEASFVSVGCQRCTDPKGDYCWPTEPADRGNNNRSDEQVGEFYDGDGRSWLYMLTYIARR